MNLKEKELFPDVYNHCNRWCDHCQFANNCELNQWDKNTAIDKEDCTSVFREIQKHFDSALSILNEYAQKEGINIELQENLPEIKLSHKHSLLIQEAANYTKASFSILENCEIKETCKKAIEKQVLLGICDQQKSLEQFGIIKEFIEVIEWYHALIEVKLQRGLSDLDNKDFFSDNDLAYSQLKIAYEGIERSMGAWVGLFEIVPHMEDDILALLSNLERTKKLMISLYPELIQFKRPYFD